NIILGGMSERYDTIFGGFGFQPKFPQVTDLRMLLVAAQRSPTDRQLLNMVVKTVDNLSQGGIYDQLGHGFHRYSTDRKWLIPHFEKMVYDNAQLIVLFLEVYQVTKKKKYLKTADEIIQYLLREMISPEGLFYSSQDADSDGREGAFFAWTEKEILEILGKEDGKLFNRYFGVSTEGNFEEGSSVLYKTPDLLEDMDKEIINDEKINAMKGKLFLSREKRNKPFLNDNVIVAWTSLTFYAFAKASFILNNNKYLSIAMNGLDFILNELLDQTSHRIRRTFRGKKKGWGFLEDYALTIQALLEVFSLTGKIEYLDKAKILQAILDEEFWDFENGGYFFTGSWQTDTYIREKPVITFSIPNANSVSLENLLRLYHYTNENKYLTQAESLVTFLLSWFEEYNTFEGEALAALHLYQKKPIEFVFLEEKDFSQEDSILDYLRNEFLPEKLFLRVTKDNYKELMDLPLVFDRLKSSIEYPTGDALIYICKDFTCSIPLKTGTEVDMYLNTELKEMN
ncbi:MAG: thioredoxin domain-containing protein, partial [Candidatus Hodarchaeales archaeon]